MNGGTGPLAARPLTAEDARAILAWRYPGPYAAYDGDPEDADAVGRLLDPANGYEAIVDAFGTLVGYFCVGPDSRAPGVRYQGDVLDLGVGMRPDLTGRGGGRFLLSWVLERVSSREGARPVRATIARWNTRAQRAAAACGFRRVSASGGFRHGGDYVVMVRDP